MISEIPKESWCCNTEDIPNLPTEGVKNGQCVINMDSSDVYMFSLKTKEWKKQ